jgi:hypothetical protein
MSPFYMYARTVVLALVSPLMEKNPAKRDASPGAVMLSMSRLIVLAFAVGMLRQMWRAGIVGWPEATLAMAIVLALPILHALERLSPTEVLTVAKAAVERFGAGAPRTVASVYPMTEPSKFDDHSEDRWTVERGGGR